MLVGTEEAETEKPMSGSTRVKSEKAPPEPPPPPFFPFCFLSFKISNSSTTFYLGSLGFGSHKSFVKSEDKLGEWREVSISSYYFVLLSWSLPVVTSRPLAGSGLSHLYYPFLFSLSGPPFWIYGWSGVGIDTSPSVAVGLSLSWLLSCFLRLDVCFSTYSVNPCSPTVGRSCLFVLPATLPLICGWVSPMVAPVISFSAFLVLLASSCGLWAPNVPFG